MTLSHKKGCLKIKLYICNGSGKRKDLSIFMSYDNKYAIYAYTHGPVTGSGPSVKPLKYDLAPYWLS